MMLMVSSALNAADATVSTFLFIGENKSQLQDIMITTKFLLEDVNARIEYESNVVPILDVVFSNNRKAYFIFSTPENITSKLRGWAFNKIIVDLTPNSEAANKSELATFKINCLRP